LTLPILQLEDRLQLLCDRQAGFVKQVEEQLDESDQNSQRLVERCSQSILAHVRDLTNEQKDSHAQLQEELRAQLQCLSVGAHQQVQDLALTTNNKFGYDKFRGSTDVEFRCRRTKHMFKNLQSF
jgi:hypothetical protein